MRNKAVAIIVAVGTVAALGAGCGNSPTQTSHQVNPVPTNFQGTLPAGVSPQAVYNALFGTYAGASGSGKLMVRSVDLSGTFVPHDYSFTLTRTDSNGQTYANFNLLSDGVNYSTPLSAIASAWYGNSLYFVFQTPAKQIPGIATYSPISIELRIALVNGTQFDPTQSKISIFDCGFYQSFGCSTSASDAYFAGAMEKRN